MELRLTGARGVLQPLDDRGRPAGAPHALRDGMADVSNPGTLWYELRLDPTAP